MTLDDLSRIAAQLPLSAPDMMTTPDLLITTLQHECGKLSSSLIELQQAPSEEAVRTRAMKHCGAGLLTLVVILNSLRASIPDAVEAGRIELS